MDPKRELFDLFRSTHWEATLRPLGYSFCEVGYRWIAYKQVFFKNEHPHKNNERSIFITILPDKPPVLRVSQLLLEVQLTSLHGHNLIYLKAVAWHELETLLRTLEKAIESQIFNPRPANTFTIETELGAALVQSASEILLKHGDFDRPSTINRTHISGSTYRLGVDLFRSSLCSSPGNLILSTNS